MTNKELIEKLSQEIEKTFANYDYSPKNWREQTTDSIAFQGLLDKILGHFNHPAIQDMKLAAGLSQDLQEKKEQVALKIAEIGRFESTHVQILEQEKELRLEEERMKELFEKTEALQKLKVAVESFQATKPETLLQNIQSEIREVLSPVVQTLENVCQYLNKERQQVESQVLELTTLLGNEISEVETGTQEHLTNLQNKNNKIKSHFHAFENKYNTLLKEYISYYEKIVDIQTQLASLSEVHEKNVSVFNLHFKDNVEIWGDLSRKGVTDKYVADLIQSVNSQLLVFDTKLKEIIEGRDKVMVHYYPH